MVNDVSLTNLFLNFTRETGEWAEPWHGDELMFVFGWPILQNLGTEDEKSFSEQMMKIWGSFAADGKPGISDVNANFTVFILNLFVNI